MRIDVPSFFIGLVTASVFWWLVGRMRPLWNEMRENWQQRRAEAQMKRASGVEENHRRITLRRAQGMHLAAPLFALDEIIETPRLLAPPVRVQPGMPPVIEDIASQAIPYMPNWPEIAAIYRAPTLSLQEALGGGINLVITGQPGIGKTVALAHLATLSANRDPRMGEGNESIPFLLHVADLRLPAADEKSVLNPIIDATSENAGMLDLARLPKFIQSAFESGCALFLLDGFDELDPQGQKEIVAYLKLLLKTYPKIQIVTTGCPEHLDGLIGLRFEPLAIMPWETKQVHGFIEKWGQLWMQTVAVESWAQTGPEQVDPVLLNSWLKANNEYYTPLELTLKLWGAYAGDSRGPRILDAIATHVRRMTPDGTPLGALETLGMQVILAGKAAFNHQTAREWVKAFEIAEEIPTEAEETEESEKPKTGPLNQKGKTGPLEKPKTGPLGQKGKTGPLQQPTSALLIRMTNSGLLVSHTNNLLRFTHPLFGGYLAGRALADYNLDETLIEQEDWSGKLLAMRYLAAHGDATFLVETLIRSSEMPLHQPLLTTARWLHDAPPSATWKGKVFTELAELMQTEGIPLGLRAQAMAAFTLSGESAIPSLFRQFLQTTSFELLQLAALGCGVVRDVKSTELLTNALYAPSISAQRAACLALVSLGTSAAMEAVARALLNGEEDLRSYAAEALANDPTEGWAMLKEGLTLNDILLRRAVVFGLARVNEEWAVETLKQIQIEDDQWVVRNSASQVLDSMTAQDPRVPTRLTKPSETDWLIEFAGKQGVGISPGSPATEVLLAALKSDEIEESLAALPYLKRAPTEGVITALYHAMYRDEPELREAVFVVLCELAAGGIKLPNPQQFGLA